jgi:hypothetical protein
MFGESTGPVDNIPVIEIHFGKISVAFRYVRTIFDTVSWLSARGNGHKFSSNVV